MLLEGMTWKGRCGNTFFLVVSLIDEEHTWQQSAKKQPKIGEGELYTLCFCGVALL